MHVTAMSGPGASRRRKAVLTALADVAALALCLGGALWLRFGAAIPPEHEWLYLFCWPLVFAWTLLMAHAFGLYDFRRRLSAMDHFFAACGAAPAGVLGAYFFLVLLQTYYFYDARLSRAVVVINVALVLAWFTLSRAAVLAWLAAEGCRVRVLLMGPEEDCSGLEEELRAHAPRSMEVRAPASWRAGSAAQDESVETGVARGAARIAAEGVDEVILTASALPQHALSRLLAECGRRGAGLYVYPDLGAALLASTRVRGIAGLPVVALQPAVTEGLYRYGKRGLDIALAAVLLVLTAPAWLAAMAAVKLTSPGPIFFSQERMGLGERPFRLYKFRTMVAEAEAESGPVLAQREDPRVTTAGRWLRRWRVDELPQLLNVLRGEMSMVGPRPERPVFARAYAEENPLYAQRFRVRPGLTGLAQIHGRYDTEYTHKIRYDLIYINSLSLPADLQILFSTIQIVITGKGAV